MKTAVNAGDRCGRLVVLERVGVDKNGKSLWVCRCDCGKTKIVRGPDLKTKNTSSCGCLRKETSSKSAKKYFIHNGLARGEAGFNRLFSNYKRNAERRDLPFALDEVLFRSLTSGPCNYCGRAPMQISTHNQGSIKARKHAAYVYNGIDRKDSSIGYEADNCVSCCETCNTAKWSLTAPEFLAHIREIAIKQGWISDDLGFCATELGATPSPAQAAARS